MNNYKLLSNIIICPDCKSDAIYLHKKFFYCRDCKHHSPIKDNIPILVKKSEQKRILDLWNKTEEFERFKSSISPTPAVKEKVLKFSNDGLNLDCGCGNGALTKYFKKTVVSIDFFSFFIKEAMKNNYNPSNVFLIADAKNLPFKKNIFSMILCSSVLEHFTKKESDALIKSLIELSNKIVLVDVPNDDNILIRILRKTFEFFYLDKPQKIEKIEKELLHHRIFSRKDLKKFGFKVYGGLGWASYKYIKPKYFAKIIDQFMRLFPSFAGTLIGIYRK